jgi:hypothetical protein
MSSRCVRCNAETFPGRFLCVEHRYLLSLTPDEQARLRAARRIRAAELAMGDRVTWPAWMTRARERNGLVS